ncbi:hypothetical protein OKW26_000781 [Paraburkholderia sp. 32]
MSLPLVHAFAPARTAVRGRRRAKNQPAYLLTLIAGSPAVPKRSNPRVRAAGVETPTSLQSMTESAEPGGKDGLHRAGQQVAQPACGHVIVQPLVPQQFDGRLRQTHG